MKIICIGRNYSEHAKELNNDVPAEPVIFLKPDTAVLRGSDFYLPEFSQEIHYETELVLKISKGGKYILRENASKHFEEITLGFDFTARDIQDQLKKKGLPWELAKAFDGSAAVGKFITKQGKNLHNLSFTMEKNGVVAQSGCSQEMIFSFDEIISYASKFFTLRTGDLIFTGTPAGIGKLEEGDFLSAKLEGETLLTVRIR